jgi:hypothetical protein
MRFGAAVATVATRRMAGKIKTLASRFEPQGTSRNTRRITTTIVITIAPTSRAVRKARTCFATGAQQPPGRRKSLVGEEKRML